MLRLHTISRGVDSFGVSNALVTFARLDRFVLADMQQCPKERCLWEV